LAIWLSFNQYSVLRLCGQPLIAAAPPTISESSLVIAAWRVLL
jgi:hypothetical protein